MPKISLTNLLKKIDRPDYLFRKILPKNSFELKDYPKLNPYPDWVNIYRKWSPFGTFTDYIIRKMLEDHFPNKTISSKLIAEYSLEILKKTKTPLENEVDNSFLNSFYFVSKSISTECKNFYLNGDKWIKKYKSKDYSWRECLEEAYYMSLLDRVYRDGTLKLPRVNRWQINESLFFFNKFEKKILSYFNKKKHIYLNPALGHTNTVSADADIITDNTILEIKTVNDPAKYMRKDFFQLLGYVSLFEWLKHNEQIDKNNYPCLSEKSINRIGFIFPQQMIIKEISIENWPLNNRQRYLENLLDSIDFVIKKHEVST